MLKVRENGGLARMPAGEIPEKLATNVLLGALAGTIATIAMTAAMRRLHRRLPKDERYPLPPREITETVARRGDVVPSEEALRDAALTAHFAYGAATGALYALLPRRNSVPFGAAYGLLVWAASYCGWVPAARILRPPTEHPARRNALMITAHLIWGAATAWTTNELRAARSTILRNGPLKDKVAPSPDLPAPGDAVLFH
jgi:hypothetical protein